MKRWTLVLLFAVGCTPQYTREQANNCAAAIVAVDSPTRETVLAALPGLIDRLKSYPPGSTGADEEMRGLLDSAIHLQGLGQGATEVEIGNSLDGLRLWFNALVRRCHEIDESLATP